MISVRFAAVEAASIDVGVGGAALSDAERARHDRLRFAVDRDAYAAAHLLVRACAADLLGVPAARVRLEQHCPRCGGAGHGRPSIAGEPGLLVSLSHTRGYVGAVAATVSCGIDVQTVATDVIDGAVVGRERAWLAAQPDPLVAFTRLWVRKEALVKVGLADDPGRLDVLDDAGPSGLYRGYALTEWSAPAADGGPPAVGCVAVLTEAGDAPAARP